MAALLWDAYQETYDLELACRPVVEYAQSHPESVTTLGELYHGYQSHMYEPEDLCPFVMDLD